MQQGNAVLFTICTILHGGVSSMTEYWFLIFCKKLDIMRNEDDTLPKK